MVHEMLNQLHTVISDMNGTTEFMEHKLHFHMSGDESKVSTIHHKGAKVNDEDLKPLVDALLDDPNVNSWLIPDFLERPMYMAMLRLMFTVTLDVLGTMEVCWMGYRMNLASTDGQVHIPSISQGMYGKSTGRPC